MSDILQFVWAVLSRWQAYISGGVVTALITIVEKKRGKAFSFGGCLFGSSRFISLSRFIWYGMMSTPH